MRKLHCKIAKLYKRLILYVEGRIFLCGLGLSFVYLIWLGFVSVFSPELVHIYVSMTATNIIFGRAAGMSLGYTMGIDMWVAVANSIVVETILVLLLYPLFVLSWKHLIEIKKLERYFNAVTKIAKDKKPVIKEYGWISLFIFVILPFWMTGPVVGAVIGFFIGLRPLFNITIVLTGTHLATILWAPVLHDLHENVTKYSPYGPVILLILMVLIVIIIRGIYKKKSIF